MQVVFGGQRLLQLLLDVAQSPCCQGRDPAERQVKLAAFLSGFELGPYLGCYFRIMAQIAHNLFVGHAHAELEVRSGRPPELRGDVSLTRQGTPRFHRQVEVRKTIDRLARTPLPPQAFKNRDSTAFRQRRQAPCCCGTIDGGVAVFLSAWWKECWTCSAAHDQWVRAYAWSRLFPCPSASCSTFSPGLLAECGVQPQHAIDDLQ